MPNCSFVKVSTPTRVLNRQDHLVVKGGCRSEHHEFGEVGTRIHRCRIPVFYRPAPSASTTVPGPTDPPKRCRGIRRRHGQLVGHRSALLQGPLRFALRPIDQGRSVQQRGLRHDGPLESTEEPKPILTAQCASRPSIQGVRNARTCRLVGRRAGSWPTGPDSPQWHDAPWP